MSHPRIHRFAALVTLTALIAVGAGAGLARAAGSVSTEVDSRKVGVQDQVQLTITVEGSNLPDAVALPPLKNLQVVGGPSVSTSMSFVNGRSSQSRSWTYVLTPVAIGPAEVGAYTVSLGPEQASAPAISIDVVAGSVKPAQPAPRPTSPFGEDPFGDFFGGRRGPEPKLFVEAKPSRSNVFVGQPLLLTYYLYTQTSVSGLQFAEAPQYPGFWAEDLKSPERPSGEPATVDGVSYRRFPVMMKLLFPTKAGRLSLPASKISVGIPAQSFFGQGGVVQRSTKPIAVDVKPIPDEPGFSGAVGRFDVSATVDRPSLALGEAATLRFKVEGTGNLKWIDRAPEVTVPGAKVYPPQEKSNLQTTPAGITGSRTWEFVVIPQTAGTIEIPSLAFSYFDPSSGRITRRATTPLALEVGGGAPGMAAPPPIPAPGLSARNGPLPLRADLEQRSGSGAIGGRAVGLVAALVLLLHGALWGGPGLMRGLLRRPGRSTAPRSIRSALGDLGRVGRGGMSKESASALIEKAIHGVFGSLDGDDSERARAVRALLDEVHSVRYAPQLGDYSERLRELASRAGEVVRRWA